VATDLDPDSVLKRREFDGRKGVTRGLLAPECPHWIDRRGTTRGNESSHGCTSLEHDRCPKEGQRMIIANLIQQSAHEVTRKQRGPQHHRENAHLLNISASRIERRARLQPCRKGMLA
jgi:hypothetical protein